jgi:hypothetical protein
MTSAKPRPSLRAAALGESRRVWKAEPGTPDHDRPEILGEIVSAYEDRAHQLDAPNRSANYAYGPCQNQRVSRRAWSLGADTSQPQHFCGDDLPDSWSAVFLNTSTQPMGPCIACGAPGRGAGDRRGHNFNARLLPRTSPHDAVEMFDELDH